MASSNELKRVAPEAEAAVSGIISALDRAERVLGYAVSHSLPAEAAALADNEIVVSNIDKDRLVDLVALLASVAFHLRGRANPDNSAQTVFGATPMTAAQMKTAVDKLGI